MSLWATALQILAFTLHPTAIHSPLLPASSFWQNHTRATLKIHNPPASVSRVLGSEGYASMPGFAERVYMLTSALSICSTGNLTNLVCAIQVLYWATLPAQWLLFLSACYFEMQFPTIFCVNSYGILIESRQSWVLFKKKIRKQVHFIAWSLQTSLL